MLPQVRLAVSASTRLDERLLCSLQLPAFPQRAGRDGASSAAPVSLLQLFRRCVLQLWQSIRPNRRRLRQFRPTGALHSRCCKCVCPGSCFWLAAPAAPPGALQFLAKLNFQRRCLTARRFTTSRLRAGRCSKQCADQGSLRAAAHPGARCCALCGLLWKRR